MGKWQGGRREGGGERRSKANLIHVLGPSRRAGGRFISLSRHLNGGRVAGGQSGQVWSESFRGRGFWLVKNAVLGVDAHRNFPPRVRKSPRIGSVGRLGTVPSSPVELYPHAGARGAWTCEIQIRQFFLNELKTGVLRLCFEPQKCVGVFQFC